MFQKRIIYILVILFSLGACTTKQPTANTIQGSPFKIEPADSSWKQLSLREKIGQTMMLASNIEDEKKIGNGSLPLFFEKYPIGGFFLASWTIFNGIPENEKVEHMQSMVNNYQQASKYPLFMVEDYESGLGNSLPGFTPLYAGMNIGATNNQQLAFDLGKSIATEARSVGLNWLLHPVSDLNINPMNPIVNIRCVSDNAEKAISLLSQQVAGMQGMGIASTVKHFPGDGIDFRDQHTTTTCNSLSKQDWLNKSGKVFQQLINSGCYSIMTGHITLPFYESKNSEGRLLPATLSKELTTQLLKKEMGFNGVVVSDALNMAGIKGFYPSQVETEIASFLAGSDVLLWPTLAYMDTLEARILRKEIPMSRLDDAVKRVWAMKERLGLFDINHKRFRQTTTEEKQQITLTAKSIAQQSVTIINEPQNFTPLKSNNYSKILFVAVAPLANNGILSTFQPTIDDLKSRGFEVDLRHNLPFYGNNPDDFLKYDQLIFAFSRHPHDPMGSIQPQSEEALTIWMINALPGKKIIAISYGDPYVIPTYLKNLRVGINAYNNSNATQHQVISILAGEQKATGISPVILQ